MSLDTYRNTLKTMTADLATLTADDAMLFASCAFGKAAELAGALWKPHAREDGRALAADFDALGRKALAL